MPVRRGSRWAFHLLTVLAILACLLAARWQWQRAHRSVADAVPDTPAVAWTDLRVQDSFSGQRVVVTGRYLASQILVAPRERDGRPGAWVFTPLVPDSPPAGESTPGGAAAMGVIRGWVPEGTTLQELVPPAGPVTATGVLVADERRPGASAAGSPPSMVRIDSGALSAASGVPVRAGWMALVGATPSSAGQPIPLEVGELPGADVGLNWRNAAYALQWLVFAAFAVFFWNRFRRDYFAQGAAPQEQREQEAIR